MSRKTLIRSESHRQSHATPSPGSSRLACGVLDDDCRTGCGEMYGNRRTNALGRSGNKCDLIVECAHVVLLSCGNILWVKLRLEISISRGADSSALWRCTGSRQRTIRIVQGKAESAQQKASNIGTTHHPISSQSCFIVAPGRTFSSSISSGSKDELSLSMVPPTQHMLTERDQISIE